VMDNWMEERKALHAKHDIVGVGAVTMEGGAA